MNDQEKIEAIEKIVNNWLNDQITDNAMCTLIAGIVHKFE